MRCLQEPGSIHKVELDKPAKDGTIMSTFWEFVALVDASGVPVEMQCVGIDITARVAMEQRLLASEAKYKSLFDDSPDGYLIIVGGRFVECNKASCEMIGMNLVRLHSEAQLPHVLEFVGKIQTEGGFTLVEVGHMRKDGTEFPSLMSAKLIHDEYGTPVYMSATVIDITEKKEQEREIEKLKLAIEQSPVAIVITDLDANIEYVSPAFEHITGYTFEEVQGRNCRILSAGETPLKQYREMWGTITGGHPWQGEWLNRRKNGEAHWESVSITPIRNESGTTTNYLAIKTDITERNRAEQEILTLNQTLEQRVVERTREMELARIVAEKANQAKSEFLSRMSHELRTPMNSILGFAQLLEMGALTPAQERGVGHILKSGKHLLQLINEVLDNGIGIEEKDMPKLFTPFERIGAEKTDTEGTGLGLTVVKKLMDVMNGRVGVESRYGSGSTFWLELPKCHGLEPVLETAQPGSGSAPADMGGTILYVEDNASNIDLVEQILLSSRPGTRLITTLFGRDALPMAKESRRDLMMPQVDGFEVMRRIAQQKPVAGHMPILVLTADATRETRQKALYGGANDFLTKPFDLVEVGLRIRNLLFTGYLVNQLREQNQTLEVAVHKRTTELREMVDNVNMQNKILRDIAWTQSHVVRAPVARLMALIDLMRDETISPDDYQTMLEHVFTSADEIDSIIRGIVEKSQGVMHKLNEAP